MKGLNRAYLIGHLCEVPPIATTKDGLPLLIVALATPSSVKVGDQWVDSPDFHKIILKGSEAEFLSRHGHKGDALAVECSIKPTKWDDKDGHTDYECSLNVDRILYLSARKSQEEVAP